MTQFCYVVTECGGMYEDSWTQIVGIYLSKESAEKAKLESTAKWQYTGKYDPEYFDELANELAEYEDKHPGAYANTYLQGFISLHPELEGDEDFKHDYYVWENTTADYSHTYVQKFELYE